MIGSETLPETAQPAAAILSLRATVIAGPDQGKSVQAPDRLSIGTGSANELVLSDETVSRFHVELTRVGDRIGVRDQGSTNGTFQGDVRVLHVLARAGARFRIGKSLFEIMDGDAVAPELFEGARLVGLVGRSEPMRKLMAQIRKVSVSDASILVTGETGSGKEVVARAIHDSSPRPNGPLEIVDCGAMQPTLIGSELFGHERGAFTGAESQHIGAFERGDRGTIFLDEIGELPSSLQTALLGALERRSFRRLGGKTSIKFDARVISATHRDLRAEVNDGSFRQDLFYRLAVVTLRVPPLRERPDDVPILISHFLERQGPGLRLEDLFPPHVLRSLTSYRWPGNVRELRNTLEAALVMGEAPGLDASVEHPIGAPQPAQSTELSMPLSRILTLPLTEAKAELMEAFEAHYIKSLLERAEGSIPKAAALARVDRSYVSRLQRRYGIKLRRTPD
ncbi:MAG: sigma 54-dependent Fis family transcriptional regulator [Deltaproteobacteria bacterium]|nr:sigma 54-dependent Fis family transcriptional regulator [Deltaproteobacteria bacterium]